MKLVSSASSPATHLSNTAICLPYTNLVNWTYAQLIIFGRILIIFVWRANWVSTKVGRLFTPNRLPEAASSSCSLILPTGKRRANLFRGVFGQNPPRPPLQCLLLINFGPLNIYYSASLASYDFLVEENSRR